MKLFRNQKPKGQSATFAPRSPPPSSLDSPGLRGGDLSGRIEPYTFGNPSPPAQTQNRASNHHHQQHVIPGSIDSSTLSPERRHSMRARPSVEDPWVVVNDPQANVESRSASIASLMQPVLGATGVTAPYISTQFIQQREREREPPLSNPASTMSASHPPSPNPPPQSRTPQLNMNKQRPPPSSSTPQPNLEQQQQQQQWQQQLQPQTQQPQPPPSGAQAPQQMNGLVLQPHPEDVGAYAMGNGGAYGNTNGGREGSIHSQQDRSWTRGLFGAATGKEKEANAELMRMIGSWTNKTNACNN